MYRQQHSMQCQEAVQPATTGHAATKPLQAGWAAASQATRLTTHGAPPAEPYQTYQLQPSASNAGEQASLGIALCGYGS
jgi:hypothetical protein